MYKKLWQIAAGTQGNKTLMGESGMPARILVVDDEVSIRNLLSRVLAREGFEVELAMTGVEGVDVATRHRPDLVILDLNLPDLYGEDVCMQIRQNPATENVPVLVLTGKVAP